MADQWIFWFEELSQEFNDLVGKKCANLGELTRLGLNVPRGFAISVKGCEQFMRFTHAAEELQRCVVSVKDELDRVETRMDTSCKARDIVESRPMPAFMEEEIRAYYRELCRRMERENAAVAVRSSGAVSMPGQMETYLNIRGEEAVVDHVKKVWGSAFTARAITFRFDKGLPIDWAPIGVAVMALIDAKSAGVALTVLPTTGDVSKIVIEGNFGLGESVVSGQITPDSFTVDKETMEIVERKVVSKHGMVQKGDTGIVYGDIAADLKDKSCLADAEIKEIARVALRIEKHFGLPQDTEWVVDKHLPAGENVFWVQARPARYVKLKKSDEIDYLIDLMVTLFK